jgi:hypothetical protein
VNTQYVALTENLPTAGLLVWWRLSGQLTSRKLEETWAHAGLDETLLPDMPAPTTALRRALRELEGRHVFVRRLPAGGWALVSEHAQGDGENDLLLGTEVRSWVDSAGRVVVEPAGHPWESRIREGYEAAFEELLNVSGWLSRLTKQVAAVGLRDTGGIYFVPRTSVELWQKMTEAISKSSGHRFFEVPALQSDSAVEAILDAVSREAEAEVAAMEADLADPENGLGARAYKSRMGRCEAAAFKVASYEALLGRSLEGLQKRLEDLRYGLGAAALKAEAERDAEEAA